MSVNQISLPVPAGIITGATGTGIGFHVANLMAFNGITCILPSRNLENAQETASRLVSQSPYSPSQHLRHLPLQWSTDPIDVFNDSTQLFNDISDHSEFNVKYLVCAAGFQISSSMLRTVPETVRHLFDINTYLPMALIRDFHRYLLKNKNKNKNPERGSVILVSSLAAAQGNIGQIAYSASKSALHGMTKSGAKEFQSTMRINTICPGFVDTPMTRAMEKVPEKMIPPEELAEEIVSMMIDESLNGDIREFGSL